MDVDWGIIARIVHVSAVVVWIGGVWFVTAIVLPAANKRPPQQKFEEFQILERRFAPQARVAVFLVLASGLYMFYRYNLWDRLADLRYWWMYPMIVVWLLFMSFLFILEPLVVHRIMKGRASSAPKATFTLVVRFHHVMLALSLIAIAAAVGGMHGLF